MTVFATKNLLELGGDECDNLNFMKFKIDSSKICKNAWILGTFKIHKIRILNLWTGQHQQQFRLDYCRGVVSFAPYFSPCTPQHWSTSLSVMVFVLTCMPMTRRSRALVTWVCRSQPSSCLDDVSDLMQRKHLQLNTSKTEILHNISLTHFFNKLLTKRSELRKRDKTVKTAQKHYIN